MIRPARPAATVCVLRDGSSGLEVLMVQRGLSASFMGGAWVFPGGIVDDMDGGSLARRVVVGQHGPEDGRWIAAALRELVEEVRIWITSGQPPQTPGGWLLGAAVYERADESGVRFDADRVAYFANWITPTMIPVRFDTRFYAVAVDAESTPHYDPRELAAAEWLAPAVALRLAGEGERVVPFPTAKTLELLAGFPSSAEFMAHARSIESVPPITPRGRIDDNGGIEVVLPGEPGYDLLEDISPESNAISKAAAARGHLAGLADDES